MNSSGALQSEYWQSYFESKFSAPGGDVVSKLDFSNEKVRQQSYACLLEALPPLVPEAPILDIGCGNGEFSQICRALGARVVGVDINRVAIEYLTRAHPAIAWEAVAVGDEDFVRRNQSQFKVVVCSEVLQYVDAATALPWLWRFLSPGSRLVLLVPNRECPIITRVMARFEDKYLAWSFDQWSNAIRSLDPASCWIRDMSFHEDQSLAPYEVGPWSRLESYRSGGRTPNRFQWIVEKAPES